MRRAGLVVAVLLGTAACGGTARPSSVARSEVVLHTTMVGVVGAVRYTATYPTTTGPNGATSCHAAATHGNSSLRQFVVGGPGTRSAPVYFGLAIPRFTGPGVYRAGEVRIDSIAAVVARRSLVFRRARESAVTMTVSADGSGSARFSDFRTAAGATISAVVSWVCRTETVRVSA